MASPRSVTSPMPILFIIILAIASLIQLFIPTLVHPGLTQVIIGVIFLVLHFTNLVRGPLTLVAGWVLLGFGVSFWMTSLDAFSAQSTTVILFGLGLAFVGIYLTTRDEEKIDGRFWPLVPGGLLLLIGTVLIVEGSVGRDRFWSIIVPLIPAIVAIWYLFDWRRGQLASSPPTDASPGQEGGGSEGGS